MAVLQIKNSSHTCFFSLLFLWFIAVCTHRRSCARLPCVSSRIYKKKILLLHSSLLLRRLFFCWVHMNWFPYFSCVCPMYVYCICCFETEPPKIQSAFALFSFAWAILGYFSTCSAIRTSHMNSTPSQYAVVAVFSCGLRLPDAKHSWIYCEFKRVLISKQTFIQV